MLEPNTFIVGAPKCGTTSLAYYLAEHSHAFVCEPKEPNYWSKDLVRNPDQNGVIFNDEASYLKLFASADPDITLAVCDASTTYIWSDVAINGIRERFPNAKIILMLRNPAELAFSLYREERFSFAEDQPNFWDAWSLQKERLRGSSVPRHCREPRKLQYKAIASVGSHAWKVKELVPEGQHEIILLDDMVANPEKVWRKVQSFLDLPEDSRTSFPRINGAKGHKYPRLAEMILRPPQVLTPATNFLRKAAWTMGLRGIRSKFFKRHTSALSKDPEYEQAICKQLLPEFTQEIDLLEEVLGRDLSSWRKKYDG